MVINALHVMDSVNNVLDSNVHLGAGTVALTPFIMTGEYHCLIVDGAATWCRLGGHNSAK